MDLKELARTLALSPTTVSRVLNGQADRYRISKFTQDRVFKASQSSGVVVNQTGRSLRRGTTQAIGIIVPNLSDPFFAMLTRYVERACRSHGYSLLLADSQESLQIEIDALALMRSRNIDGVIVAPVGRQGLTSRLFAEWGKRLVIVDRAPARLHPISVVIDHFEAARQAVLLLAGSGHRAIACIHGDSSCYTDHERVRGYHAAMKELGFCRREEWVVGDDNSIENGRRSVIAALSSKERPTALVILGHLLTFGALTALREMHLSIPNDVSLISFDEQPWAASMAPPLTTVAQPVDQMGHVSVMLLLEAINERTKIVSRRIVLPFSIVERASILKLDCSYALPVAEKGTSEGPPNIPKRFLVPPRNLPFSGDSAKGNVIDALDGLITTAKLITTQKEVKTIPPKGRNSDSSSGKVAGKSRAKRADKSSSPS